jgi:RNA polymerase sigma-70 factor, ECF subfamily
MVAFNTRTAHFTTANAVTPQTAPTNASELEAKHDAVLVSRFRGGDDEAFAEIVARYQEKTFAVAFARLHNHADAEEITQDTFIRAHRALGTFRGESSLATWLHRIAVNLSLNRYWYFFRRRRHLTQSLDSPLRDDGTATVADYIASEAPSPVGDAMTHEFTQLVATCMTRLSPGQREILRLRTVLDRSYEEIAISLGLNIGTVKSRIARARHNLHALITDICPEFAAGTTPAEWFGRSGRA